MKPLTLISALAILVTPHLALAQTAQSTPTSLAGLWSIGPSKNCETGAAWLFFADGHYLETKLPEGPIAAVGIWRETSAGIIFTHAHPPFDGADRPMAQGLLTYVERSSEKLVMLNRKKVERVFHRCPISALKAAGGIPNH